MKANMTVMTEGAINRHYNASVERTKATAFASARDSIIENIEQERKHALELFAQNGELKVYKVGAHWTIVEPKKNSDAKIAANARYDAKSTTGVYLKLNNGTDADILAWLETVGNKQGYIKALIRADMNA